MKKRFRDYGFNPGLLTPGSRNSITDVAGLRIGHVTKNEGEETRTGLTLIDPGTEELFRKKLPAAIAVGNGFGKLAGYTQVEELGTLETPIALTNTLAVGPVVRGLVDLVLSETRDINATETINAVVGETNDGIVNRIHADVIQKEHVAQAWKNRSENVTLGCVGAGTGTRAFSWKGGIGTASRIIKINGATYTLGALVQTNYGGNLTIMGTEVGRQLGKTDFDQDLKAGDGSCMIVFATDAPLTARQLKRIASRAFVGLARTGSVLANGSGDYAIAFSTNRSGLEGSGEPGTCLADKDLNLFFLAAAETVEESVYDALFTAESVSGRDGNLLEALPVEQVIDLLKKEAKGENNETREV